jgi:hypothetical protein
VAALGGRFARRLRRAPTGDVGKGSEYCRARRGCFEIVMRRHNQRLHARTNVKWTQNKHVTALTQRGSVAENHHSWPRSASPSPQMHNRHRALHGSKGVARRDGAASLARHLQC